MRKGLVGFRVSTHDSWLAPLPTKASGDLPGHPVLTPGDMPVLGPMVGLKGSLCVCVCVCVCVSYCYRGRGRGKGLYTFSVVWEGAEPNTGLRCSIVHSSNTTKCAGSSTAGGVVMEL